MVEETKSLIHSYYAVTQPLDTEMRSNANGDVSFLFSSNVSHFRCAFVFVFLLLKKNIGIELDLSYDLEVKVLLSTFGLTLN